MSRALKCDKCGCFYEYYKGFNEVCLKEVEWSHIKEVIEFDLCPKCAEILKQVLGIGED